MKEIALACFVLLLVSVELRGEFVLKEIPSAGHMICAVREDGKHVLNYNDRNFITIEFEKGLKVQYHSDSDDVFFSSPLRELYTFLIVDDGVHNVKVKVNLSQDAGILRTRRAAGGEAILAQLGNPLIYGVNGLYDMDEDASLEWYCDAWKWDDTKMKREADGTLSASFSAVISNHFMNFYFRPHYYRDHLGYRSHEPWTRRLNARSMNGWCSWVAYYYDLDAGKIERTADFIAKNFIPYGMNFLQVDNGFQGKVFTRFDSINSPGVDRRDVNLVNLFKGTSKRFPEGPPQIAKIIEERGLEPGIWMNTDLFAYEMPEDKRDILCRRPNGKATQSHWIRFMADMSDYTITNYYVPLFKYIKDAGFKYLKVDGMRHTFLEGLNTAYVPQEARRRFRNLSLAARLTCGDDMYLMSCWGVMNEIAGAFDACRVSVDCGDNWEDFHRSLYYFAEFYSTHRIVFVNDPDHVVMHAHPEWSRTRVSNVSLTGGLLTYSDKNEQMTDESIYTLQRALPALETRTAECGDIHPNHPSARLYSREYLTSDISEELAMKQMGPSVEPGVKSPFSTLWAIHIEKPYGQWCVAQRNAIWSLAEDNTPLAKLGLDPAKTYLGYDFWEQKFIGEVKDSLRWDNLLYGRTKVIALREKLDIPQLIGSSRHVSMDAISVTDIVWEGLNLKVKLKCVPEAKENYAFYVPGNYTFEGVDPKGGNAEANEVKNDDSSMIVNVALTAESGETELNLRFKSE